ncbi:MAG TPA: hypothetical protein VK636_15245 [Gemmatimonadaceae bacterium]|nr:hypothetical protein [Gemmatimonadaceae bacterium]
MTSYRVRSLAVVAAISILPIVASAQAPAPAPATPGFSFSGTIFGAYSYKTDSASKAQLGGSNPNAFSVDRAYLTFRMPAGDNGSIRITTDIFQNTNPAQNPYYQGWVVRLKYAYLDYTGLRNEFGAGSSLAGRIGILHTVVVDHEESFWPRYLNQTGLEKNGFFSSSDAGVAGLLTLGNKWGEIYGTITNGSGYSSYDNPGTTGQGVANNRFKDFGIRASLTPFANQPTMPNVIKYLTITPWYYKGFNASAFQSGGAGQNGPGTNGAITDGLTRDRYGLFAAIKDTSSCDFRNGGRCRYVLGGDFAQRTDQSDNGGNTSAIPRVLHDSTGRLFDAFLFVRPIEIFDPSQKSPFSIVARWDNWTPNTDPGSSVPNAAGYAGTTPAYNFFVLGASWDVNQRITFTADYQNQSPTNFPAVTATSVKPTPQATTLALHFVVNF